MPEEIVSRILRLLGCGGYSWEWDEATLNDRVLFSSLLMVHGQLSEIYVTAFSLTSTERPLSPPRSCTTDPMLCAF